jgi:hypothetical protein
MARKLHLMKCGHVGNMEDLYGNPLCGICYGINNDADKIVKECIDSQELKGRKANCVYCDSKTKSKWELPLFKYCPEEEFDEYYCGCYGE